jgi:hypothetical protein
MVCVVDGWSLGTWIDIAAEFYLKPQAIPSNSQIPYSLAPTKTKCTPKTSI